MRRAAANVIANVASAAPALACDIAAAIGAGLLAYGAWLAYPPAGYIVLGVMMLAASVLSARRVG